MSGGTIITLLALSILIIMVGSRHLQSNHYTPGTTGHTIQQWVNTFTSSSQRLGFFSRRWRRSRIWRRRMVRIWKRILLSFLFVLGGIAGLGILFENFGDILPSEMSTNIRQNPKMLWLVAGALLAFFFIPYLMIKRAENVATFATRLPWSILLIIGVYLFLVYIFPYMLPNLAASIWQLVPLAVALFVGIPLLLLVKSYGGTTAPILAGVGWVLLFLGLLVNLPHLLPALGRDLEGFATWATNILPRRTHSEARTEPVLPVPPRIATPTPVTSNQTLDGGILAGERVLGSKPERVDIPLGYCVLHTNNHLVRVGGNGPIQNRSVALYTSITGNPVTVQLYYYPSSHSRCKG